MNRAYNDNKEYTDALDGLLFSDEAKARMVQNLLDAAGEGMPMREKPRKRKFRLPRVAAVGVAAALVLGIGAGASGVLKTAGEAFSSVFGSTADTEIIDQIGRPIGASDTDNGVTVTADAILFDGYNYMITYSIAKDDGSTFTVAPVEANPAVLDAFWDIWSSDIGLNTSGGHGGSWFIDDDPTDNAIQYVDTMSYDDMVKTGGTVKVTFGNLRNMDGTILEGEWNLKFKLEAGDLSTQLPAGQSVKVGGKDATVEEIRLSPIGYRIVYTVSGTAAAAPAPSGQESAEQQQAWEDLDINPVLHLADGTAIDLSESGGSRENQGEQTRCIRSGVFNRIIPLEDVVSLTLGGVEIPVAQ